MAGGGSKDGKGGAEAARAAPKKKRGWRCAERPAREREGLLACSRHAVNAPMPLELADATLFQEAEQTHQVLKRELQRQLRGPLAVRHGKGAHEPCHESVCWALPKLLKLP